MGVGACQEAREQLFRVIGGILDYPVPHVGKFVDFSAWPSGGKFVEALGREAPVLHAPHQELRQVSELRQAIFDLAKGLPSGMRRREGNVFHELIDRRAAYPGVVGSEIPGGHGGIKSLRARQGHPQGGAGEGVASLQGQFAKQRPATDANPPGDKPGPESPCVEQHDSLEAVGGAQQRAQANRPAPILSHERDSPEIELFDQTHEVVDMLGEPQGVWLQVAEAAAEMIGGNAAKVVAVSGDKSPPVERPSGITMDEEEGLLSTGTQSFIEIVHAPTRHFAPVRSEGIEGTPVGRYCCNLVARKYQIAGRNEYCEFRPTTRPKSQTCSIAILAGALTISGKKRTNEGLDLSRRDRS